jgi:hypothetical protein
MSDEDEFSKDEFSKKLADEVESLEGTLRAWQDTFTERGKFIDAQTEQIREGTQTSIALSNENQRLREIANDALEVLGECDTDNVHVEVWCIRHQEKWCDVPQIRARFDALSTEEPTNEEPE